MDELLALMEEAEEEEDATNIGQNEEDAGLDELAALWDNEDEDEGTVAAVCSEPIPKRKSSPSSNSSVLRTSTNLKPAALVTPYNDERSNTDARNYQKHQTTTTSKVKPVDIGLDDKLGIRMINRKISSVDMLDIISTNPYKTPATLSALCLQNMARLLVDPPQIVDRATVSGKLNVVTVGIVFSNSGTKFSKKGSAFSVLTIGSFVSGPCVTVMLFGDAYSKYSKASQPGQVVALLGPRLMPPKDDGNAKSYDGDTAMTVTCTNLPEFRLVATARDFGTCKFTGVPKRQPNGQWTNTGKCTNYVDIRQCEYCDKHNKARHKQGSTSNMKVATARGGGSGNGKMSAMRKLKLQHQQNASLNAIARTDRFGRGVAQQNLGGGRTTCVSTSTAIANWSDDAPTATKRNNNCLPNVPLQMKREKVPVRNRGTTTSSSNRLLNGQGRVTNGATTSNRVLSVEGRNRVISSNLSNRLLNGQRMKNHTGASNNNRLLVGNGQGSGGEGKISSKSYSKNHNNPNPYSKKPSQEPRDVQYSSSTTLNRPENIRNDTSTSRQQQQQKQPEQEQESKKKKKNGIVGLGDILNMAHGKNGKRKIAPSTSLARSVMLNSGTNCRKRINTAGGGFDGSVKVPKPNPLFAQRGQGVSALAAARTTRAVVQEPPKEQILQKQKDLANQLRATSALPTSGVSATKAGVKTSSSNNVSFFDTVDDNKIDTERVINARSRFQTEADAEEYARKRAALVELEKEEATKTKHNNSSQKEQKEPKILKQWYCRTCQKSFDKRPQRCIQRQHDLKTSRELNKKKSKTEERSNLNKKDASDGGLQLAQGLDWSAAVASSRRFN